MTEQEAMNKIQALVLDRRKKIGVESPYKNCWCTKCHNAGKYLVWDIVNETSECEECFIKRKYSELAPQITEEDSSEVKAQRAQFVKDYFTKKKHEFKV